MKTSLLFLTVLPVICLQWAGAAQFDGAARIEITDPNKELTPSAVSPALTVSCWFKLSVPSSVSLTKNMVIVANARTASPSGVFAYAIQFNILTGNVEFSARGAGSALPAQTLVARPYLERWYHVAITRSGATFTGYIDGRQQFSVTNDIGASENSNGVFIGGTPDDGANLYGEVQEFAIYRTALPQDVIVGRMFEDQPVAEATLRGYYKLGGTPNPDLANYAGTPPAGTSPATKIGNVTFENASLAGEQSTFDSHRNGGRDAIAPLSGGFSWERTLFSRATKGIPFELKISYSSGIASKGLQIPQFTPFDTNGLGAVGSGWSHTFDIRLIPSSQFEPIGTNTTLGLLLADGSLEVFDGTDGVNFRPRHGEYRGEMTVVGSGNTAVVEWVTPERVKYRFRTPFAFAAGQSAMRGRLIDISDFNPTPNVVTLTWNTGSGRLLSITDTAGGVCTFQYNSQPALTSIDYLGWTVTFTYNAENRLATFTKTGPAAYASAPALPTTWGFFYRPLSDTVNGGLLEKIADPRGYNGGNPSYHAQQVAYDAYGRVISEKEGLLREEVTKYNVPAARQISRADAYQSTQGTPKYWIETFDRRSRVIEKKDPLGNTTTFEFDASGNLTASVDALNNRTEFTYDTRSNPLTRRNVALNQTTTWQYHPFFNKPVKQIDPPAVHGGAAPASWETIFEYDSGGNLLRQFDALGDLVTNTYSSDGQLQTAKDARGFTSSFTYTPEGFLRTRTVPDIGGTTRTWNYTYTELGWLKTEQNPVQPLSQFFYDLNGNVTRVIDPLGRTVLKTFDGNGNLLTETDAKGQQTVYGYDNANQRITMQQRDHTASAPRIWTYGYTLRGEPLFVRDPSLTAPASSSTYEYDDAGRRIKETDANGFFSTVSYDAVGNVRFVTDKEGHQSEQRYDSLNRVITSIDPLGNTTVTTYDNAGRLDTITNPRGNVTRHEYDGRARLLKWTDPEGYVWRYIYDGGTNIIDIIDAEGGHYPMTYGPRGERLTERNQDFKTWTYTYDELLRLKTQTDPDGITRTLSYDDASRVDTVNFSTGRSTVFFYDDNNNPTEIRRVVAGVTTKTTLTYDPMDRVLTAKDTFNKTVGYSYDAAGRLKSTIYPGGQTLTRNYDPSGRLTGLVDWAGRISTFGYDKAARLTSHAYPNGISSTFGYDDANRVTTINQGPAANPAQVALSYAYDRAGNKASEQKKGVLDWQPGSGAGQVPEFDESYTTTAAGRLISSADAANALRNTSYGYSERGNMTSATSSLVNTTFTYDEDNRATSISYTAPPQLTQTVVNRYDALGRRISRTLSVGTTSTETRYVLDLTGGMERILCDTDSAGIITARYVHGPDGLGYKDDVSTGAITCYHADAMGNILRLTDGTGAATADYTYNPYGRVLATTGNAVNSYRFVGSQGVMEEFPNLYFMRARYYSAEAGVFLSVDPVKNIGPGWKSMAHLYGDSNPVGYIDPKGEYVEWFSGTSIKPYYVFGYGGVGEYGISVNDRTVYSDGRPALGLGVGVSAGTNIFGYYPGDEEDWRQYDRFDIEGGILGRFGLSFVRNKEGAFGLSLDLGLGFGGGLTFSQVDKSLQTVHLGGKVASSGRNSSGTIGAGVKGQELHPAKAPSSAEYASTMNGTQAAKISPTTVSSKTMGRAADQASPSNKSKSSQDTAREVVKLLRKVDIINSRQARRYNNKIRASEWK